MPHVYPPAHSLHINEERCKRLTGRKLRQLVQIQLGCEPWREREREERERRERERRERERRERERGEGEGGGWHTGSCFSAFRCLERLGNSNECSLYTFVINNLLTPERERERERVYEK